MEEIESLKFSSVRANSSTGLYTILLTELRNLSVVCHVFRVSR